MISIYNTILLLLLAIGSSAKFTLGEAAERDFDTSSLGRFNFSNTPSSSARSTKSRTSSNSTMISSKIWVDSTSSVVFSTITPSTWSDTSFSSTSSFRSTITKTTTLSTSSTTYISSTTTSTSSGGPPGVGGPIGGGPGGSNPGKPGHSKGHHSHSKGHNGGGPPGGGPPGGPPPSDKRSSTSKTSSTSSDTTSSSDTSSSTSSSTASACPLPTRTSSSVISTTSDSSNVQRGLQPTETSVASEHNLEERGKPKPKFTMITRQDPISTCLLSTAIRFPAYPGPAQVTGYEQLPTPRPSVVQNFIDTVPRWYIVRQNPDPLALPAFTVVDTNGLAAAGPGGGPVHVGGQVEPSVNIDHVWERKFLPTFIGDQLDDNVFDCDDLKTIFLALDATGLTRLQTLANLAASKTNPEFLGILSTINVLKGGVFDGNVLLQRHFFKRLSIAESIAELREFIIMFDIFREQEVIDLFQATNERVYRGFQNIDDILSDQCIRRVKNGKPLKPIWAESFRTHMDQQISKVNDVAYTFASRYSSTISEVLAAEATEACPPPDHADNQRNLDILTQNNIFSREQLSFDFGLTYPPAQNLKSGCSCRCFPCLPCFCRAEFDLDDDASMNMTESTSMTCSTSTTLSTSITSPSMTLPPPPTTTSCDITSSTNSPKITFNAWSNMGSPTSCWFSKFIGTWEFANPGCCMNMTGQGWGAVEFYQSVDGCTLNFYTDSLCQEGQSVSKDQIFCFDTSQYNSVQVLCG